VSDGTIVIRITTEGPKTRIAIEVPESVRTALKAKCITEHRTQSDLATEALIRFITAPIGSYPAKAAGSKEGAECTGNP